MGLRKTNKFSKEEYPNMGMRGKHHSEETKHILSDKFKIIAKEKGFGLWVKGRKMSDEEKKMRSKIAKEKGMGNWMKKVWEEGRASPNSLNALKNCEKGYWKGKELPKEVKEKLSEARKKGLKEGRIKTWNKGLDGFRSGEENSMWKGGISFEPYDINFNKKFKREIRKRDNQVCMLCGIHKEKLNRALSIHHINYNKELSIPENCISLCISCHGKTNDNRNHWTKFFQSLLSERYNYSYSENLEPILNIKEIINGN